MNQMPYAIKFKEGFLILQCIKIVQCYFIINIPAFFWCVMQTDCFAAMRRQRKDIQYADQSGA